MAHRILAVVAVLALVLIGAPPAAAEETLEQRLDTAIAAKLAEMGAPGCHRRHRGTGHHRLRAGVRDR